jgi:hypothetical protein
MEEIITRRIFLKSKLYGYGYDGDFLSIMSDVGDN